MKVSQMTNANYRAIANQFIITDDNGDKTYQSYQSAIVKVTKDQNNARLVLVDSVYWNYSRTTSKYRAQFLGETTAETRAKIASGIYQLANLN